jgi:hypothetical protein
LLLRSTRIGYVAGMVHCRSAPVPGAASSKQELAFKFTLDRHTPHTKKNLEIAGDWEALIAAVLVCEFDRCSNEQLIDVYCGGPASGTVR